MINIYFLYSIARGFDPAKVICRTLQNICFLQKKWIFHPENIFAIFITYSQRILQPKNMFSNFISHNNTFIYNFKSNCVSQFMKGISWRFYNSVKMTVKILKMNVKKYNIIFAKRYLSYFT